jgi:Tol biopolymer transport system component
MEIYTARADGSDVQRITQTKNCYNGGPFFSPDGKRIIFRADRQKPDMLQLMVVNSDGGGERQLTEDQDIVNWCPFWHPAGRSVIYATSRHGHWNYELYLLNVESGAKHRVTWRSRFDGLPAFSPDGAMVMWTSKRSEDTSSQLFIADFRLPEGF